MAKRNSATRQRLRARIARDEPSCHICGKPIDYTLPHLDPGAFVIDHVVALKNGGEDALPNIKAAHRRPRMQQQEASPHRRPNH